jgi:hypothetical protein
MLPLAHAFDPKGTTKRVAKRRKGPAQQEQPTDSLQDAWGQLARLYKYVCSPFFAGVNR